jgi:hypothetical protein
MRIISFSMKTLFLALFVALLVPACKDDEPTPDTAKISGTITIDNADLWNTWKDSGEVQLALFPEFVLAFPPAGKGWGVIPDGFFGAGIPGGTYAISAPVYDTTFAFVAGTTQLHYELEVPPGTYSALALGFRHDFISDPNLRTATLGVHWDHPTEVSHGIVIKVDIGGGQIITVINDPAPSVITVEKGDNVTINFRADFGFVEQWF